MKKFLTSAIAAALVATTVGVFVACGDKDEGGNKDAELAQKGLATVIEITSRIDEETPQSYTVLGQTKVEGKTYNVKWAVSSEFPSYETYVSVGEKDSSGKVTINITKAQEVVEYTLKATVTVGKASKSEEFKHKIPAGLASEEQKEVTMNFKGDGRAERTNFTATEQVWEQNGIKLTNTESNFTDKAPGSSADDVRLYKNSKAKIEYPGMSTIVFHTTGYDNPGFLKTALDATGVGTATIEVLEEGSEKQYVTDVTFVLNAPADVLEFSLTAGQVRLTSIDVIANKAGATDADKVAGAKAVLDIADKTFLTTGTYNLPAEKNGVAVAWALKAGTTSDYVSINNEGKLVIGSMPEEETEVALTATLSLNGETATKDFTIKLILLGIENDGTQEHPYKPSEAKKVTALLGEGNTGATEVYVKGYVVSCVWDKDFTCYNIYIADEYTAGKDTTADDVFYLYAVKTDTKNLKDDGTGLNPGDLATFKGKLQYYKPSNGGDSVLELTRGGECVAVTAGNRTDADIVADAKKNFDLTTKKYNEVNTAGIDLPTTFQGATLAWALKAGTTSTYVAVEGNKLKINSLPNEETKVTLTVTFTKGTAAAQTNDIEITLTAPAVAATGTFKYGLAQETIGKKLYFKGTVNASGFAETTESVSEAADVVVAATEGGYTIKVGEKFFELYTNAEDKVRIKLSDTFTKAWVFNAELGVFTWTEGSKVYYVGSYGTFETFSPSETKYIKNTGNFAAKFEDPASKTDADKINDALALVKATLTNITAIGKVTLPASTVDGVSFVWALATDNTATCATVIQEDGAYKLNVTALPEDADATVKLVVTASCGDATDKTKSVSVTVEKLSNINYGTVAEPLSVTETLAITAEQCKAKDDVTKQVVTVKGIVSDKPADKNNGYYQYTLKDITATPAKTIVVYSKYNLRDNVATPAQNDTVIVSGYITNYNGTTIEFAYLKSTNVYVESNVRGTSTIAVNVTMVDEAATATVTDLEAAALPATATNGTKISFRVAPATGRTITAVKVNGATVNSIKDDEEDENSAVHYELTVAGNMTILVETIAVGETEPVVLKTITFNATNNDASVSSYTSTFNATQDGLSWKVDNFNNNANKWDMIKCGRKKPNSGSGASVAMLTTKTAVDKVIKKVDVTIDSADASLVNSFKLLIADNAEFTNATEVELTIEAGVNSFVVPAAAQGENKYYRIVIDCAEGTGNGFVQLSKVELWGDAPATSGGEEENTPAPEAILNDEQ